jgi:hypothetical protein
MEEYEGTSALDAGLLAAAQAVEHYEISRYGTLKSWAGKLSMASAVRLLDQNAHRREENRRDFDQDRRRRGQRRSCLKGKTMKTLATLAAAAVLLSSAAFAQSV